MKTRLQPLNYAPLNSLSKLILTFLLLLPLALTTAQADLELLPASSTVNVGDNLTLTLQVVAGSQEVDGVEAYLNFDPNFVTINTVTFEAGAQLPIPLVAPAINPAGEINSAHGLFGGGFVIGTFDYITIDLTADAAGSTAISFSFDPGPPINRATLISRSGFSVLGNTIGANITIVGSNTPPTVSITAPTDGATVNEGDNVTINATAADPGGSVTGVEFFDGATSLGTDNTAPYSITLNNISAGAHTLTAVATDSESATTTSTPVNITANATGGPTVPVITIGGPATKIVAEEGNIQVPISVSDLDGDNLTVTISSVSNEPQFLQSANGGTQADPFPINADNFLTTTNVNNTPGSYAADLNFDPVFGDGGGADGDGSGEYTVTIDVSDGTNNVSSTFDVEVTDVHQVISSSSTTRIEAESFDNQGPPNGSAGNTSDSNGIGVEINPGAATNIGFTNAGDFAEYFIDVVQAGTYDITFQVAKSSGAAATMTINGGPASISVSPTGGWQTYTDVTTQVTLSAGQQTLRLDWSGAGFLFNTDYFDLVPQAPNAPPVITLLGADPLNLIAGDTYTDPGATALDDIDGDITANIVVGGDVVDTNTPGAYVVTYNVSDGSGNPASEVTRTVNISSSFELPDACTNTLYRINVGGPTQASADATPLGWEADTGAFGTAGNSPYLTANSTGGSTYSGNSGSAHPGAIITSDPSVPSSAPAAIFNTERYDAASAPEMKWEFPVVAGTEIQVTLLFAELFGQIDQAGERVFDVEIEGVVLPAFDDIDPFAIAGPKGAFTRSATLTVNDGTLDIEFIHGVENPALKGIQICQISGAVDNTPPVITLLGTDPIDLIVGDTYTDPGVTASDDTDGDITVNVVVGGDVVDPNTEGTYVVTYNVSDVAGNPATEVTRTVNVAAPDQACAYVAINPSGNNLLTSSTFSNGLIITNNSQGTIQITSVSFDLGTAIYPNMVFDPIGTAGDNLAKCLTIVSETGGDGSVGLSTPGNGGTGTDPDCVAPFAGETEIGTGGYYVMNTAFNDFEPGESINLSIDIDPTSIEGFASAGNAGAISGLELIGSTITVEFSNGQSVTGELYRIQPGLLDGSENYLYPGSECAAPTLTVLGANPATTTAGFNDATVGGENQVVQISGTPGDAVSLLILESTIEDLGPGITPGEFEANKAQTVEEIDAIIGAGGTVDIPVVLADNASGEIYHLVAVKVRPDDGICGIGTCNTSDVWRLKVSPVFGDPSVLVEITPGGVLGASTYGGSSSLQITNNSTGNLQVTDISIDLSTGILPDMVFDPVGTGGDATAQCFIAGSTATAVGLVAPTDICVDPFSVPRFGGFDIISLGFTEFDPGENFTFSVDIDPNSIKDVPVAGNAGAVSGYELSGATVTISFNDGSTIVSSLYEDGSLGGGQTVVEANAPAAPAISVVGVASSPATVGDLNQTVTVSGTPGDNVSLLLMDSRLFIASNDPPFNVTDPTYYANEAMSGKTLYTAVIEPDGDVDIPITLLVTPGATGTPDGGLNQLIAVSSATPYEVDQAVSQTSNVVTLLYDPNAAIPDLTIEVTRQGVADYSGDYTVKLYQVGAATPDYDLIGTADAAGIIELDGIAPGTYEVAVKYPNCLQIVEPTTITGNGETLQLRELRTGDVNNNNAVNILDFSLLVNSFDISVGETGYNANANLNGDLIVNILDFSLLISNFLVDGEEPSGL